MHVCAEQAKKVDPTESQRRGMKCNAAQMLASYLRGERDEHPAVCEVSNECKM